MHCWPDPLCCDWGEMVKQKKERNMKQSKEKIEVLLQLWNEKRNERESEIISVLVSSVHRDVIFTNTSHSPDTCLA